MALVKPVIFQITGFQNSGKTTFIVKLIQSLTTAGMKTVTIKHHGHGGKPDIPEEKDSAQHLSAGAAAALVEGGGRLILQTENCLSELEEQIKLVTVLEPDVILIEGHKHKDYPKLVLLRDEIDFFSLNKLSNIVAFAFRQNIESLNRLGNDIPAFSLDDEAAVLWITQLLKKCVQNGS